MIRGLKRLYSAYGGLNGLIKSGYFWVSFAIWLICVPSGQAWEWTSAAQSVLPSLTGFSIAAFAIVFAVLTPEQKIALLRIKDEKDPPLVRLFSSITHATLVQVTAIAIAFISGIASDEKILDITERVGLAAEAAMVLGHAKTFFQYLGSLH
ncbi:hypothetical protein [Salibaculum halophilum]|uniref:hypothetical protein n=1 Tax=Salibaculum halophilum TaxID=1914408 RepID=UPI00117A48ED|nr:hypothetical protein [Salibaculum halophilum]